jgi:hypothetical protein
MTTPNDALDPALQAALQAIADAGVDPATQLEAYRHAVPGTPLLAPNGRPIPTVAEYLATVFAALVGRSYASTWRPHLEALAAEYGERPCPF